MTEYPDYISDFLQSGLSYTIAIVLCETLGGVFSLKTSLCTFYMVLSELYLSWSIVKGQYIRQPTVVSDFNEGFWVIIGLFHTFSFRAIFYFFVIDGPVPLPNMPNQIMNRMQVSQGTSRMISVYLTYTQTLERHKRARVSPLSGSVCVFSLFSLVCTLQMKLGLSLLEFCESPPTFGGGHWVPQFLNN